MSKNMDDETRQNSSISFIGHFAHDGTGMGGQIRKTRWIHREMQRRLPQTKIYSVDTGLMTRRPVQTLGAIHRSLSKSSDAIVLPGKRGLQALWPVYLGHKAMSKQRIHYIVIGGWLPDFLQSRPIIRRGIQAFDGVYVETERMVRSLEQQGLKNVHLSPNCRDFDFDGPQSAPYTEGPMRLVYLSRVIPEKGVETVIEAVREVNRRTDTPEVHLDIWGPVPQEQQVWWEKITSEIEVEGANISYRGVLSPEDIYQTLAQYDVMVFPTYYWGEGFAGVIIEAFVAGLAVVVSDWKDNASIVRSGEDGLIFAPGDAQELAERIFWILEHPEKLAEMKANSARRAREYHVDTVIPDLLEKMELL